MPHNHWSNGLPYLVPVWHSLSSQNLPNTNSQNSIDPNLDLDFGGIGMYNEVAQRHYRPLQFKTNRPMLPFYIKPSRIENGQASRNCLAFSTKQNVLFSSQHGQLKGFNLGIDEKRFQFDVSDVDCHYQHRFTDNQRSESNPFCYHTEDIWHLEEGPQQTDSQHILDIRLEDSDRELEVWTHSRNSLKLYKYYTENDQEVGKRTNGLRIICDINASSTPFFPSEDSLLNYWDRSDDISDELLASFIEHNSIYRWNVEVNKCSVERTLDTRQTDHANNLIGVHWAKRLNPFLYYYGTHSEIFMGDIRQNMNGSQKASHSIMNAQKFTHFKNKFELFQTFMPNPMEAHQIITSSDFSINFLDIRYPNKNILQCKHMLTSNLASKLYAKQVRCSDREKMMLIASNSERSCLFTFDSRTCIQPIMEHYPFYLNIPREAGNLLPLLKSDNTFITGTQILPGKSRLIDEQQMDFFSIALLANNGDIYMQDFWPSEGNHSSHELFSYDFKAEQETGDQNDFSKADFDDETKHYLKLVFKYLKKCVTATKKCFSEHSYINYRIENHRKRKRLKLSDSDDIETNLHNTDDLLVLEEEGGPLNNDEEYSDHESISFSTCKISEGIVKCARKGNIDLELIKDNWTCLPGNSAVGLRDTCSLLTVALCDQWFKKMNTQIQSNYQ